MGTTNGRSNRSSNGKALVVKTLSNEWGGGKSNRVRAICVYRIKSATSRTRHLFIHQDAIHSSRLSMLWIVALCAAKV